MGFLPEMLSWVAPAMRHRRCLELPCLLLGLSLPLEWRCHWNTDPVCLMYGAVPRAQQVPGTWLFSVSVC